ncbi:MAG: TetR/AcrR family transcriptional regulator [Anaerolineales bacterium]
MSRDTILEAAAQIFSQRGFHAASMQDIAHAVNLQKASLYHHVASKQELLVELLDKALDLMIDELTHALAQPLPAGQKLQVAVTTYLNLLAEHSNLAAVLLLEYRSLDPEYRARHQPRRDRFERLWRNLIEEGVQNGEFCCTDSAMAARALLGAMNWFITWYRPDGLLNAAQIAQTFSVLFLNGLHQPQVEA